MITITHRDEGGAAQGPAEVGAFLSSLKSHAPCTEEGDKSAESR